MQEAVIKRDAHPSTSKIGTQLKDIEKTLPLRVLSPEDWQHWVTRGYVIVRQAVPRENVERLVDLLWAFDEKDPNDPSTWYAPQRREHKMKELNNTGMLEIYNHQYLWDNRMEPRVYDAFVDIWDREDLWVTIDRANLNAPKKNPGNPNGFIHWDADTSIRPLPIGVQGVLSLKKQDGDVGGFPIADFAHHDHVRILPQHGAQTAGELDHEREASLIGHRERHQERRRASSHRSDVSEIHRRGLPSEIEPARPREAEVGTMHERVDGRDDPPIGCRQHGCIISGTDLCSRRPELTQDRGQNLTL